MDREYSSLRPREKSTGGILQFSLMLAEGILKRLFCSKSVRCMGTGEETSQEARNTHSLDLVPFLSLIYTQAHLWRRGKRKGTMEGGEYKKRWKEGRKEGRSVIISSTPPIHHQTVLSPWPFFIKNPVTFFCPLLPLTNSHLPDCLERQSVPYTGRPPQWPLSLIQHIAENLLYSATMNIFENFVFMKIRNTNVGIPRHHCTGVSQITDCSCLYSVPSWRCCAHPSRLSACSSEALYNSTNLGSRGWQAWNHVTPDSHPLAGVCAPSDRAV